MKRARRSIVLVPVALAVMGGAVALAAASPSVSTGAAANVTTSGAKLEGTVNPNGDATSYHFEIGLTTSYGDASPGQSAGRGTKNESVSANVGNLLPGTVYHYRLDAQNAAGGTLGSDRTFKTAGNPPPDAATGPANDVSTSSATLTGVVTPNGQSTAYQFQYGLTTAYGYATFGSTVPPGNSVTVSNLLQGLEPGTTFHYRIVAYHGSIAEPGGDGTFITEPSPRPTPALRVSITPSSRAHRPFDFTVSGSVRGPAEFPASDECTGEVVVRYLLGTHQFAHSDVPLASDCSYTLASLLHFIPHLNRKNPRARVSVVVRFEGNGYLAPVQARRRSITVSLRGR
jgi:hypothetical protein